MFDRNLVVSGHSQTAQTLSVSGKHPPELR